ncbi:MAG: TonB-dependent receptor [Burkholderiales bacterium]|nr:TonB-dependent receptor [Burkholderiales bacterium]
MSFYLSAPRAPRAAISPLCLCLLAAFASSVSAQATLQPIVVTGSREPQPLERVTADVVVIDAERIRSSTADSVEDLLRREAGMQLGRNGGPGKSSSTLIRGAASNSVVVLIDGVRIGSATLGQAQFEGISLAQIDRIEVLRGPGSSLYGTDAVGGVVQIFTKRGEGAPSISANAAVGSYRSYEAGLGISGGQRGFDYTVSLARDSSRGVSSLKPGDEFGNYNPDRDGYKRDSALVKLGYTPLEGHRIGLSLNQSRLDSQYDASEFLASNGFNPDATPDFRGKLKNDVVSLDYRGVITPAWTTSAQIAHNNDDLLSGGTVKSRYRTKRDQLTWQNAWTPAAGQQLVFAFEHLLEKAQGEDYVADVKRNNNALVLGYTGQFGAHVLQADVRHDDNSVYGNNTTGRLGWSMEIAKNLRLRALAGNTFRAPSFNELYYPGYGVSTLAAERGRSVEIGLNWRDAGSELAATVYRNRVRDLIAYESDPTPPNCPADPAYSFGCARNIGNARMQGATLSGSHRFGNLRIAATLDTLDAQDTDAKTRLIRRAAHQESLSADYDMGAWSFGAGLLAVGERPEGNKRLGSYETLDLRARWRFAPQWQLEARLLNATGRDYEPTRDYQALGRQAWVGVRFDGRGW